MLQISDGQISSVSPEAYGTYVFFGPQGYGIVKICESDGVVYAVFGRKEVCHVMRLLSAQFGTVTPANSMAVIDLTPQLVVFHFELVYNPNEIDVSKVLLRDGWVSDEERMMFLDPDFYKDDLPKTVFRFQKI